MEEKVAVTSEKGHATVGLGLLVPFLVPSESLPAFFPRTRSSFEEISGHPF